MNVGPNISTETCQCGDIYKYDYVFVKDEMVETIVDGPNAK